MIGRAGSLILSVVVLLLGGLPAFVQAAEQETKTESTFKDCPACPEMVVVPAAQG